MRRNGRRMTYTKSGRYGRPVTLAREGLFCVGTRKRIYFSMSGIASIDEIL